MAELARQLPGCLLWKIRDTTTGGQPDLEVCWNEATTKLEFKLLKGHESIHDKWEDGRQLATLVRYEQTTKRAWVVAYRRGSKRACPDETLLYRPTSLLHGRVPETAYLGVRTNEQFAIRLWNEGVIRCVGWRHDLVASLVRQTHV